MRIPTVLFIHGHRVGHTCECACNCVQQIKLMRFPVLFTWQLQVGEFIFSINGCSTRLLSVEELTATIKGEPGSSVELEISSTCTSSRREEEATRNKPENKLLGAKEVLIDRGANGGLGIR